MKENVERSDPVAGYQDVTPEQLDARHANCDTWTCNGHYAARQRRLAARASESTGQLSADVTERLQRINSAMEDVGTALAEATRWTNQVLARESPWGHVEIAREDTPARVSGEHEEPLAEWERLLLEGAEAERSAPRGTPARQAQARLYHDSLQAGLQHQRIVGTFVL